MAIAYVSELGSKVTNSAASTTEVVTLSSSATGGNTVVACIGLVQGAGTATTAVTDSRGNTWTTDFAYNDSQNYLGIASTHQDVATLQSGDTVTFTFSQTSATTGRASWVEQFSGVKTSVSPADGSNHTSGNATACGAAATVTPSADGDVMITGIFVQSSSVTVALNGTGTVGTYSAFTTAKQSFTAFSRTVDFCYQVLSTGSGVSQDHAFTLGSSNPYDALTGAYKSAPPPVPPSFIQQQGLRVVGQSVNRAASF